MATAQSITAAPPLAVQIAAGSRITFGSNGTPLAGMARSIVAGPITGSAVVNNLGGLATPVGNLPLTVSRSITAANVARGIAAAARIATPIGAAITIAAILEEARCRQQGGGILCDAGLDPTTNAGRRYSFQPLGSGVQPTAQNTYPTQFAAVEAATRCERLDRIGQASACSDETRNVTGPYTLDPGFSPDTPRVCGLFVYGGGPAGGVGICLNMYSYDNVQQQSCSTGAIGPDGRCPGGLETAPNEQQLADIIAPGVTPARVPTAVGEALDRGATIQGQPIALTGPGVVTGSPSATTTTGPSGTTTSTTTPRANVTYAGDTVTYNITNQTVINNNGQTTTIDEQLPQEEPEDPCIPNPGRVGCQQLGDAPTDPVPRASETVTFSAESVALPSACPDPIQLMPGQEFSFANACNVAGWVRPLVLALAAFAAASMMVFALRS